MNVKLVRITTGEDIICDLVEETDDTVTFANPIVAVPSGNGQIGFAPGLHLSKDVKELTINKKFVMYISETQEQMVTEYESMFSPIITPNKNLSL